MKDTLIKATAAGLRIYAATTTELVNEAVRRHGCQPLAAAALGRVLTGALLLAANLKNQEAVTLAVNGDGVLGKIVADGTPEGFVRGKVANPRADLPLTAAGKLDVGGGVGRGLITVTRFTGLKEPVTGSAELVSGEIAEDLTNYLYTSEQTPSCVALGVLVDTDFSVKAAGGFLVQPLPGAEDEAITRLEENLATLKPVSAMVDEGLTAQEIAGTVLAGFEVKYLAETSLAFRCHCSRRRIEDVLLSLGHDDLAALVEDGQAEVCCDFCGEKYHWNREELAAIMGAAEKLRRRT